MSLLALVVLGVAESAPFRLVSRVPLAPDAHDAALETAAGLAPPDADHVEVVYRDSHGVMHPAEHPLPRASGLPGGRTAPAMPAVDLPGHGTGALSGRAVYLSQCHGWLWFDTLDAFSTQRGNVYDTVEDFHNPEATNQFLARMLENAGAAVYTVRERDPQPRAAVVDDGDPGYVETGSGFQSGGAGWSDSGPWAYGENPFTSGGTRRFPADDLTVARWTPDVPADGWYAVYVSWDAAPDHAPDARYRLTHAGGVIERRFDQRVHGSTWQYVDTLWLPEGVGGLRVELGGPSRVPGALLSADAIRIGGGLGDVERHGSPTGRPRWEDAGVLSTQFLGAPASVYDPYDEGNGSDPSSRSRWAAWEHPDGEDAVYVSWHSNAGGGSGTSVYTYEGGSGPAVEGSETLGQLLNEELVEAIRANWDPAWRDRGHRTAAFSEVNPYHNPEMPAALVELAFHDHPYDVELLKDPRFRLDSSRAMTRAIIRYFAERDGIPARYPPEPPVSPAVRHGEDGTLVASWNPGPSGFPYGDPAARYRVETSADGRAWRAPVEVDTPYAVLDTPPGETVFVRVSALNDGGASFPSPVMGARRSPDGRAPVLVVNAFDRFDGGLLPWEDVPYGLGNVRRMDVQRVNAFDTVVAHGTAISSVGWPWESTSDERYTTEFADEGHALVIWSTGEESTVDETLDTAQQGALRSHVQAGGALWASGAEILWDLDFRGDAEDGAFAIEILGAALGHDDAGTTRVTGEGPLAGLLLDFGEEDGATYPVEFPDVLDTARTVIARYEGGGVAAAFGERVALFGFPFETIGDPRARDLVAAALLPMLVPDYAPPSQDTGVTAGDSAETPDAERVGPEAKTDACGCGSAGRAPAGAPWVALAAALVLLLRRGASRGRRLHYGHDRSR
ncbi:MAG: hypothetical protein RLZZ299_1061 [Pseudomonadota bacterium]